MRIGPPLVELLAGLCNLRTRRRFAGSCRCGSVSSFGQPASYVRRMSSCWSPGLAGTLSDAGRTPRLGEPGRTCKPFQLAAWDPSCPQESDPRRVTLSDTHSCELPNNKSGREWRQARGQFLGKRPHLNFRKVLLRRLLPLTQMNHFRAVELDPRIHAITLF